MRISSSNILLWAIVIASILLLTGQGQPDIADTNGRGLSQSLSVIANVPRLSVSPNEAKVKQNLGYGNIPLYFVPNRGQVNEAARFYARTSRYTLWLTAEGLVFDRSVSKGKPADRARPWERELIMGRGEEEPAESLREVHRLVFMGANPEPEIEGEGGTGHTANYFIGSDPAKWRTNITTSRAAVYKELYPNIDLKVYGVEKQIEYDWLVKPGGDPEAIDFVYQDVLGTEIDADGDLIIRTELGEFRHRKPDAYQEGADGTRESVEASFREIGPDRYGFTIGEYDPTRPLIIDPVVLIYSTYLGGNNRDTGRGIAVDSSGCAYVTGFTSSLDFPLRSPFQGDIRGTYDAFVIKLSADGENLLYSTYLGGYNSDYGIRIALDSLDCAYITGYTYSASFPTRIPYQSNLRGEVDGFVAKLAAAGNNLVYSTYLGGSDGYEEGDGISIDSLGCAFVTGVTWSSDFPTRNPFQTSRMGIIDAFVTKFSATGDGLIFSTYLGGNEAEVGCAICVDGAGCACVTGYTSSLDFPTKVPFQENNRGSSDAFISRFSENGDNLIQSTYLGGSADDLTSDISIDNSGCIYITGHTWSPDFPAQSPFQANLQGVIDGFVAKLASAGNILVYSTYIGGTGIDYGMGISVDGSGCAYITGSTMSPDFPIRNPFQVNRHGETDAFVAKLSAAGAELIYSSYFGGSAGEYGYDMATNGSGSFYITGLTSSYDFPTQNAFQMQLGGQWDTFVTKLDMGYIVTAAVSGAGGLVSPATQIVVSGQSATVNIYPDAGYAIASITDNGGSVAVANPYVINNVREDHDVVVTFARVYTVTASVSGIGGTVSPATQTVNAGEPATINIYPDLGYHIGSIRDNGASVAIASPYIITNVQEDHAVIVTFANEPPTIKIVNPTNDAKVYGVVTVKAEASDDLQVLKVAFLIDEQLIGEDAFAEATNIYTQAWDTRGYTFGTHRVKAVAFDEAGLTAEDEIIVFLENVALTLQGQRLMEKAWILKKQFIRLTINIQNFGQVSVAKYVVYRKNGTGDFKAIKEIPASAVTGPSYVWDDMSINKNLKYTYRILALSSGDVVLGVSNDLTL